MKTVISEYSLLEHPLADLDETDTGDFAVTVKHQDGRRVISIYPKSQQRLAVVHWASATGGCVGSAQAGN